MANLFANVTEKKARPLPVFILADDSGSMSEHGKADSLKKALQDMIVSFKDASKSSLEAEIYVSVITFGNNQANVAQEPAAANTVAEPENMQKLLSAFRTSGSTPLGMALNNLTNMMENKDIYPSRAYRPFFILASDGMPNDNWEEELKRFKDSERAKKGTRLALAIGPDASKDMLEKFIDNPEIPVFSANNANEIRKFFKCVTMSIIKSSISATPGQIIAPTDIFSDNDDIFED